MFANPALEPCLKTHSHTMQSLCHHAGLCVVARGSGTTTVYAICTVKVMSQRHTQQRRFRSSRVPPANFVSHHTLKHIYATQIHGLAMYVLACSWPGVCIMMEHGIACGMATLLTSHWLCITADTTLQTFCYL